MAKSSSERPRKPWEEDPWEKKYPYEFLKHEVNKKEKIATVTLSNPTNDGIPYWAGYEWIRLIDKWERDDDVKVIICKGGGKNFCTGEDLSHYLEHVAHVRSGPREVVGEFVPTPPRAAILERHGVSWHNRLLCSLKPTIAQVHGYCNNAGMGLMRCFDMVIASDDAHFGEIGMTAGISGYPGTPLWHDHIGRKIYRELVSCGRTLSARQAAELGIINRVVPREKLDEEVWKEAKRIALIAIDGLVTGKYGEMVSLYRSGAILGV